MAGVAFIIIISGSSNAMAEHNRHPFPPHPMQGHPGNVFLEKEVISIPLPETISAMPASYKIMDDASSLIQEGKWQRDAQYRLNDPLPIGWYRVEIFDADDSLLGWTSLAVLAELKAPVPMDSPIS